MVYTVEEIRTRIKPVAEKYGLRKVYLFGSYVRGEADEQSDVDLAIVATGSLAVGFSFYRLYDELEKVLELKVDLLTVEGLMRNQTHIGRQVYEQFESQKELLYEAIPVGT